MNSNMDKEQKQKKKKKNSKKRKRTVKKESSELNSEQNEGAVRAKMPKREKDKKGSKTLTKVRSRVGLWV